MTKPQTENGWGLIVWRYPFRRPTDASMLRWISSAWRGLWQIYLPSADAGTARSLTAVTPIALAHIVLIADDVSDAGSLSPLQFDQGVQDAK